jgi:histone H3/H4
VDKAVQAVEDYIARLARAAQDSAAGEKRKTIMDGDIDAARGQVG